MSSRQSSVYNPAYMKNSKLLKKIPENPKYKNIKSVINSGSNVRKYLEAIQESQKNINFKKDECFKRIKLSTFVKLVIEVFSEIEHKYLSEINANYCNAESSKHAEEEDFNYEVKSTKSIPISETVFSSVVVGIGEMDLQYGTKDHTDALISEDPLESLPYLLLDVRDKDDFNTCNIISAKSYPYPMLSRAYTYETKDLLKYKNVLHKLIIVYDEDETIASRVATTLVQRGYDNIYMLSGGLRLALDKFPRGLMNGNLFSRLGVSKLSEVNLAQHNGDHVSSQRPLSSNMVTKNAFSQDDIALLHEYLNKHATSATAGRVESLSRACSRMSRAESGIGEAVTHRRIGIKSAPSKSRAPWK